MAVLVAFFVGLIAIPATGGAATVIDSDINENTTWGPAGSPYTVVTYLDIQIGATLTIEAGVLVKFDPGYWMNINNGGALVVNGTPGNEVVFTSSALTPAPGDWGYIFVAQGGTAAIDWCEISYAGDNVTDALRIVSTSPVTVSNCDIHDNLDEGIQIDGGAGVNPTITNTTLRDNGGAAAEQGSNTGPSWSNVTMSGNADNSILVTGDYSVPVTLDGSSLVGGTFKAVTGIDIGPGGVLTLAAGTTLTFDTGEWLNVNNGGELLVNGTGANPVVFTSGQAIPQPGDWGYIFVAQGGTASIDQCEISYAGDNLTDALRIVSTSPVTVSNCDIHDNLDEGIQIDGGEDVNPTITNTTIRDNGDAAAEQGTDTGPTWTDITISGNGDNSILLTGDYSVPVTLDGSSLYGGRFKADTYIDIGPGGVLTIAAGTTLTFDTGRWLNVNNGGELVAVGTNELPVAFTSSQASPAPGDWQFIAVNAGGIATFRYCEIAYAGSGLGALRVYTGESMEIYACDFHDNSAEALALGSGADVSLVNSLLHNNGAAAIQVASNSTLEALNNTIAFNEVGFEGGDATVTLVNNLITHNATKGVESDPAAILTIQYNDVFNPGGVNFVGIPDPTGSTGNISVNPVYLGPYFGLANYSPVIDAGTSNGTPQDDYYDRPRRNHPDIPNTGGGSRPWYDMGAVERFCFDGGVDGWCEIFIDGFESGDTSAWSGEVP
jgi:hypothetical protein